MQGRMYCLGGLHARERERVYGLEVQFPIGQQTKNVTLCG
jgi:hypothetical protein